jgi:predicted MPP superfamily phosphohydrolase
MSDAAAVDANDEAISPPRPRARLRRFLGMFTFTLGTVLLLHLYIASRLFSTLLVPPWAQEVGMGLVLALFAAIPVSMVLRRRNPDGAARLLLPLTYYWMGAFCIFLTVTFATDLARWLWMALHGAATAQELRSVALAQSLAILGLGAVGVIWATRTAKGRATVERVRVPIPGLGEGLEGLRIVQISDVHIGETLRGPFLERTVEHVNSLDPDVVAVTGDLVDGTVEELREQVKPLSKLRAKLGVFYVTGNHEYYWDGPGWMAEVRRLGLTALHNEHRVLERNGARLALGGVTDIHGGDFAPDHASRPDLAFAGAPQEAPRILLAHQPLSAEASAKEGVALQLSGHTHGGQIFPFNLFVRLQQPVVQGLKKVHGMWVYAHRGTGFWGPPMRLGPTPEIAQIELVRA